MVGWFPAQIKLLKSSQNGRSPVQRRTSAQQRDMASAQQRDRASAQQRDRASAQGQLFAPPNPCYCSMSGFSGSCLARASLTVLSWLTWQKTLSYSCAECRGCDDVCVSSEGSNSKQFFPKFCFFRLPYIYHIYICTLCCDNKTSF